MKANRSIGSTAILFAGEVEGIFLSQPAEGACNPDVIVPWTHHSLTGNPPASLSDLPAGMLASPMTVQILERDFPTDHLPLLRWLMFTGVCAFGFVLVWYYGLFRLMLASDKTYISAIIIVLYVATSLHCFLRTVAISRELDAANRVAALVSRGVTGFTVAGQNVTDHGRHAPAAGAGHRPYPQPHPQGPAARAPPHRPDASAARARRRLARTQPAWLLRQRRADEARPARHHHRLHPDAGSDRRPRCRRPRLGEELDGPDERRHGGRDVHDADRPDRLDPAADAILSARRGDGEAVRARHRPDRGVRRFRSRARAGWTALR